MKILVVEDENALREVIVRSLEKERYVVESASSFREASLKINDYDYDCIVLDIMLPGGSGLTLLKELRALRKKDTPASRALSAASNKMGNCNCL